MQTEDEKANIIFSNGMDRIISDLMHESDPTNVMFFPFIQSSILMGMNLIDNESGTIEKRAGCDIYLDNPDNEPVQNLYQYTNNSNLSMQIRISGNSIYVYRYEGNSWNTAIPSPTYLTATTQTQGSVGANLAANTTYYYKVTALNATGETTGSLEVSAATTATAYPIVLDWYRVQPATGYNIYRSTTTGTEVLLASNIQVTTFTDSGGDAPTTTPVPTTNTALGPQWKLNAMNVKMRAARLDGFLFLSNGIDPYMFFDGVNFYEVVNNSATTTLTSPVFTGTTTLVNAVGVGATSVELQQDVLSGSQTGSIVLNAMSNVTTTETVSVTAVSGTGPYTYTISATLYNHNAGELISNPNYIPSTTIDVVSTEGYPPDGGWLLIGAGAIADSVEIIKYNGLTQTSFLNIERGYNSTPLDMYPALPSYTTGQTVNVFYGAPPISPELLYQYENRIYAGNLTGGLTQASLLQWSAARGDITDGYNYNVTTQSTYSRGIATGTVDESLSFQHGIQPSDGEPLTGMEVAGNTLFLFKDQFVFGVTPDTYGVPYTFTSLSTDWGTRSQESITNSNGYSWWASDFGIFNSKGSLPMLQSRNIMDLFLGIPPQNLPNIVSAKHNDVLYFSVGSTSESFKFGGNTFDNAVFVFNELTSHWFMYTYPFLINAYQEMYNSSNHLSLYFGDTSGNTYVQNDNVWSDGLIDISILVETRFYYFKSLEKRKNYTWITARCSNGTNATLSARVVGDYISDWVEVMSLPLEVNRQPVPREIGIQGRGIAYKITESSSAPFILKGLVQEYSKES